MNHSFRVAGSCRHQTGFARDVEGGCEHRSRIWVGYQIIDGKGVCVAPEGFEIPVQGLRNQLQHEDFSGKLCNKTHLVTFHQVLGKDFLQETIFLMCFFLLFG